VFNDGSIKFRSFKFLFHLLISAFALAQATHLLIGIIIILGHISQPKDKIISIRIA
jgi:hypothetical protein